MIALNKFYLVRNLISFTLFYFVFGLCNLTPLPKSNCKVTALLEMQDRGNCFSLIQNKFRLPMKINKLRNNRALSQREPILG